MEEWKDIQGFRGFQVSNQGRIRSHWERKRCPTGYGTYRYYNKTPHILPMSDDGNGYLKVFLHSEENNKSYCKKVHRLVAEAFIPKPDGSDYTVDHIRSGKENKLDNSVDNLQWMPRRDNIQKAYLDGVCDERIARQNKPIVATDLWTMDTQYFHSIGDAAAELGVDRTAISHVLRGDCERTSHYIFEYAGREERLLHEHEDCY